jgi:hypothetical protein
VSTVRAADLPEGSVVADDRRGIAFYANGAPGEFDDRWGVTGEADCPDSMVQFALDNRGATVLRIGDGQDQP